MSRVGAGLLLVAAALPAATACSGLELQQDRRLHFTAPKTNALTALPVHLTWTMDRPTPGTQFAVFLDRAPMKVGKTLASVLPDGIAPTPELLANARVYVTSTPDVTISQLPDRYSSARQRHTATVVLVDANGRRTNESAWSRSFDLPKQGS